MGIDEAGRGPVLGPMVIAGVVMDKAGLDSVTTLGIADSKKLSPNARERLFGIIEDEAEWIKAYVLWPDIIDEHVERNKLNILECDVFSSLMDSFSGDVDVFIDSPLKPEVFKEMLLSRLKMKKTLCCSFKADALYPVVSAASVIAKVMRDRIIETLKLEHGDFGSGYPSDPLTIKYVNNIKEIPYFVRTSWKTFKQKNLFEL